ncbi:MAG: tetratricopeptide repeat protein [Fibrella sp.]|nr:tetratricopeptide repeat protein [Armatimonadota bacterium]
MATSLLNMGFVACHQDDYPAAEALYKESLAIFREMNHQSGLMWAMEGTASSFLGQGKTEDAVLLLGGVHAMRERIGVPHSPPQKTIHESQIEQARQELGETHFAEIWAKAVSESWGQTVAIILGETR